MTEAIPFPTAAQITAAHQGLQPYIHRTPVLTSTFFNQLTGADIYFKCENFQKIGAFKMRGATNALLQLKQAGNVKNVGTHSSGNHAQALSLAAKLLGFTAYIVMPENSSKVKIEAVQGYGGNVILCEPTQAAREKKLAEVLEETGAHFVPPFDDDRIITGQATAAKELIEEVNNLDIVLTPVGGGGLLSGTALSTHYFAPGAKVYGAEPENANDAWQSFQSGEHVKEINPNTIADGLRTTLSVRTFHIIREHVSDILVVSEAEICKAMQMVWERMKIIIEPSSAVAVAAAIRYKDIFSGKKMGIIITGGNVDLQQIPF